ncbi:DUF924 family protein [Aurantimonas sp. A2-1-M11]|uniref:DUF924 family protein n=1 Tax=Aurantimonas sp. A2-1-M11 TaxID=3113712 RepID=UPI002F95679D
MSEYAMDPQIIVDFWRDAGPKRWFAKDDAFDATIRHRFGDIYEQAAAGDRDTWIEEPTGALALVILLDQFPRNIFRNSPRAFATDDKALAIARIALERRDDRIVGEDLNAFLAIPLMHSEDLADQEACVAWMEKIGELANQKAAEEHRDIIARFGRFPHRNAVLGRQSTAEEREFLESGGFSG